MVGSLRRLRVRLCVWVPRIVLVLVRCRFFGVTRQSLELSRQSSLLRGFRSFVVGWIWTGESLTSHHGVGAGIDCVQNDDARRVERDHGFGCARGFVVSGSSLSLEIKGLLLRDKTHQLCRETSWGSSQAF